MHTNGNQYIITLNRGKGFKKKGKKTIHSFFSRRARFYLYNCFRIFPLGVAVEKYLLINSRSLHSDKSVSPKAHTIASELSIGIGIFDNGTYSIQKVFSICHMSKKKIKKNFIHFLI